MAFIESQQNPGIVVEVDPASRAGRVSLRPLDHTTLQGKILGHYSAVGTTSAALYSTVANLAAFRWADPTNFAVIMRIWFAVQVVTAVTAQRVDALNLFRVTGYTARDLTNATAIVLANQNQKARSTMAPTLMASGNFDVASAAAGLTGGTKTVDTNPYSMAALPGIAGLGTGVAGELYAWNRLGQHPLVLAANEGIIVQWGATALATGTATTSVGIEWAEVASF